MKSKKNSKSITTIHFYQISAVEFASKTFFFSKPTSIGFVYVHLYPLFALLYKKETLKNNKGRSTQ